MKQLINSIIWTVLLGSTLSSIAQNVAYKDTIYSKYIKSVIFEKPNQPLKLPLLRLNSNDRVVLEFDDLGLDQIDYYYKLIHCDRNWQPSTQLNVNDYMDGFNNELIENYQVSRAIYTDYFHYNLTLPNEFTSWSISGNYILYVYADDNEDYPVLTRRFVVSEQIVPVFPKSKRPINTAKKDSHIEMDIDVDLENINAFDPLREISIDIIQNNNWNTRRKGLIGQYMAGNTMKYNYNDSITFPSYKEFRSFDIRSLNFTTQFISTIDLTDVGAEIYIFRDKPRAFTNYLTTIDANGNRVLDVFDEILDVDVDGDYSMVTFTLEYPEIFDGDIYVIGELSDWDTKENFKLDYVGDGVYKNRVLLKQGYYDYMYAIRRDNNELDIITLEGSWYETENQYAILVYYSQDEARYDRVLGFTEFNSNIGR